MQESRTWSLNAVCRQGSQITVRFLVEAELSGSYGEAIRDCTVVCNKSAARCYVRGASLGGKLPVDTARKALAFPEAQIEIEDANTEASSPFDRAIPLRGSV